MSYSGLGEAYNYSAVLQSVAPAPQQAAAAAAAAQQAAAQRAAQQAAETAARNAATAASVARQQAVQQAAQQAAAAAAAARQAGEQAAAAAAAAQQVTLANKTLVVEPPANSVSTSTSSHKILWLAGAAGVALVAGGVFLIMRKKAA
jgi:hypothetical protein